MPSDSGYDSWNLTHSNSPDLQEAPVPVDIMLQQHQPSPPLTQEQEQQDDWGNDQNDEVLQRFMDQFEEWGNDYDYLNLLVVRSENIDVRKYL